jgi:hypothetical protein
MPDGSKQRLLEPFRNPIAGARPWDGFGLWDGMLYDTGSSNTVRFNYRGRKDGSMATKKVMVAP